MIILNVQIWCNETQSCVKKQKLNKKVSSLKVIKRYKRYLESKYPNYSVFLNYTENPKGICGQ